MDLDFSWAWICLLLATFPATMAVANLFLVRRAQGAPAPGALVSILIPARNEAANIAACLDAALAATGVAVEVVVMDDGSTDRTAEIVRAYAARDARVRLENAPPLPPGWTGKVHACARLAEAARGTHLLFSRGGVWNWSQTLRLDNPNTTALAPLTFGAYGSGAAPVLLMNSLVGIETGEWQNTTPDGGYVFRGLKLESAPTSPQTAWGIWLRGTVSDVLIEDVEFTRFYIGLNGQGHDDIQRVTVRNSRFIDNRSQGVLGTFNNSLFEGNLFEGNNALGSAFEHGTYLSNFTNLILRNNYYLRNSVLNGVCAGGNMTFHGMNDGLLIEGNTIQQDSSLEGCWLMSITQGYGGIAEGFRNTVVRNAINAQYAPGILVEDNVIINTNPIYQIGISVGHTDYPAGDLPDGNATVRNNIICQSGGATGPATTVTAPDSTVTNNVIVTGEAAVTGVCAY